MITELLHNKFRNVLLCPWRPILITVGGSLMIGFPIIHPLIRLEIKLEEIRKLHIHEEVIPDTLLRLTEEIRADRYVKHPVIVDWKTLVVLDGMHRVAAIENLRCRFIPVCLVEYDNPHILIGCWYRMVNHSSDLEKVVGSVRELGFTVKDCQRDIAHKLVEDHVAVTSIVSRSRCFAVYGPQKNIKDIYDAIKRIELKLESKGYSISYDTERDALDRVSSGKILSTLMVPTISKRDVVRIALRGEVFAHKATRHVIPVRPLFIDVPLDWLYGKLSLEKANEALIKHLSKKQLELLPPGQVLDRRYEEELYLFK